jgi:hypothetical protein
MTMQQFDDKGRRLPDSAPPADSLRPHVFNLEPNTSGGLGEPGWCEDCQRYEDDPVHVTEEQARANVRRWWEERVVNVWPPPQVLQTRIHERDMPGGWLRAEGYTHISLPFDEPTRPSAFESARAEFERDILDATRRLGPVREYRMTPETFRLVFEEEGPRMRPPEAPGHEGHETGWLSISGFVSLSEPESSEVKCSDPYCYTCQQRITPTGTQP